MSNIPLNKMEYKELCNSPVSEPSPSETIKKEDDAGLYIKVVEPCEPQISLKMEYDLNDQKIKEHLNHVKEIECSGSLYLEVDAVQESVENTKEVNKVEQNVESIEGRIINTFDKEQRSDSESEASGLANKSLHVKDEDASEWGLLIQNVTTLEENKYDVLPENSSKHDMTEIHLNVTKPCTPQMLISKDMMEEQLVKQNAFLGQENEFSLNDQKNITNDQLAEQNTFLAQQLLKEKLESELSRNEQNITKDQLVKKNTVLSHHLEKIEDTNLKLQQELMATKQMTEIKVENLKYAYINLISLIFGLEGTKHLTKSAEEEIEKAKDIVIFMNLELKKNKQIVVQQSQNIEITTKLIKMKDQQLNLRSKQYVKLQQELLATKQMLQENKNITNSERETFESTLKRKNSALIAYQTALEMLRNKNKETEEIMKLKNQEMKMTLDANLKLEQELSNVQQMFTEKLAEQDEQHLKRIDLLETHENVLKCSINELYRRNVVLESENENIVGCKIALAETRQKFEQKSKELEKAQETIKLKNQRLEKTKEMMRLKHQELTLTFDANVKLQKELSCQKQILRTKINELTKRNIEEMKQKTKEIEQTNGTIKLKNQLEKAKEMMELKNQEMTLTLEANVKLQQELIATKEILAETNEKIGICSFCFERPKSDIPTNQTQMNGLVLQLHKNTIKLKNEELTTCMIKLRLLETKNNNLIKTKTQELEQLRDIIEHKNRQLVERKAVLQNDESFGVTSTEYVLKRNSLQVKDKGRSELVVLTQKAESMREQKHNSVKDPDKTTQGLYIQSLFTNDSLPIKDEIMADDLGIIEQNISSDEMNKIPTQDQLVTKDGISKSERHLSKNDNSLTTKSGVLTRKKRNLFDDMSQLPDDICAVLKSDGSKTQQTHGATTEPELKRIKTKLSDP